MHRRFKFLLFLFLFFSLQIISLIGAHGSSLNKLPSSAGYLVNNYLQSIGSRQGVSLEIFQSVSPHPFLWSSMIISNSSVINGITARQNCSAVYIIGRDNNSPPHYFVKSIDLFNQQVNNFPVNLNNSHSLGSQALALSADCRKIIIAQSDVPPFQILPNSGRTVKFTAIDVGSQLQVWNTLEMPSITGIIEAMDIAVLETSRGQEETLFVLSSSQEVKILPNNQIIVNPIFKLSIFTLDYSSFPFLQWRGYREFVFNNQEIRSPIGAKKLVATSRAVYFLSSSTNSSETLLNSLELESPNHNLPSIKTYRYPSWIPRAITVLPDERSDKLYLLLKIGGGRSDYSVLKFDALTRSFTAKAHHLCQDAKDLAADGNYVFVVCRSSVVVLDSETLSVVPISFNFRNPYLMVFAKG